MASLDPQYLDAIKGFEGYSAQPYWDYKQSTSGYGTKAQPGDENIPPDQRRQVFEQRFQDETGKAAASVDAFAPNLPPGVRAALTSLTFNAGPGWQNSGLGAAVKAGDYDKAQQIFLQYNHAGGQVDSGLTARRQKEAGWFGGGLPQTAQAASVNSPSPPSAPLNIAPPSGVQAIPQQQAPIFAPPPQQAPQALPQQVEAPQFAQIPQGQMPPIFYAPRRPVNLTALRGAFQSPVFPKG